jgi:hypothetical protein
LFPLQEELANVARAPQFWQQMRALSSTVQRGSIDGRQFGFAPTGPGVNGFLEALQEHVDANRQEQKGMWKLLAEGHATQPQPSDPSQPDDSQPSESNAMDES